MHGYYICCEDCWETKYSLGEFQNITINIQDSVILGGIESNVAEAVEEINVPLDFNDDVFSHVVSSNGILDGAAFLSFTTHFDADGNGYLRQSELNRAASEYISGGHNQPLSNNGFTDQQLLAAGWSQEQIEIARSTGQI